MLSQLIKKIFSSQLTEITLHTPSIDLNKLDLIEIDKKEPTFGNINKDTKNEKLDCK